MNRTPLPCIMLVIVSSTLLKTEDIVFIQHTVPPHSKVSIPLTNPVMWDELPYELRIIRGIRLYGQGTTSVTD